MKSACDIRLRALEPEDLDLVYRIENDADFWRHGTTTVPFSRYVLRQYIETASYDLYADAQVRFVIEATDEQGQTAAVGLADLTDFSPLHLRAQIALAILPEYQGLHIATRAVEALVAYARHHHLRQLYAVVATTNEPARHVFRLLGFEVSATLRSWLRTDAVWVDAEVWQHILHTE